MENQGQVKRRGRFQWVFWAGVAAVIGAIDVSVFLWEPEAGSYKSPWAVPVFTFFFGIALYAAFTELMRQRLVAEMRGKEATPAAPRPADSNSPAYDAAPPLRVEVSSTEQIPAGTLRDSPAAIRARRAFDQSIALHRHQVYLLMLANGVVACVALAMHQPFPLWGWWGLILAGVPLAFRFLEMLGRGTARLTIQYVIWFALHAAWVVATLAVCVWYVVRVLKSPAGPGSLLAVAAISALAIGIYVVRLRIAHRRLRNELLETSPVRLLFLWVFGDGMRINSLLSGIGAVWRCVGPLQYLQGGGAIGMGSDAFRHFAGRALVADTEEEVDARIAKFMWHLHPTFCMYSTNTLLCGDRSWRHALHRLLDTDLVLMDLCGFSAANAGCVYEIGRIVDRIDASRAVFLVDNSSDMTALRGTLEAAWAQMSAGSPNRRPEGSPIRLFHCDEEAGSKDAANLSGIVRNAECLVDLLCAHLPR